MKNSILRSAICILAAMFLSGCALVKLPAKAVSTTGVLAIKAVTPG